jgi:hypothetical protein
VTAYLNATAAVCAFIAAVFWLRSASTRIPQLQIEWGGVTNDDPFVRAMERTAKMNQIAALFSGLAAIATAAGDDLETWQLAMSEGGTSRRFAASHQFDSSWG